MTFIDSGAFVARYMAGDEHHRRAVTGWKALQSRGEPCATSNFVLDETLTLLGRRAGNRFAAERARAIYGTPLIEVLRPDEEVELEALELFEKFADQEPSFTDCVSWALMRRRRLKRAFSFDHHFERAGFEIWP